MAQTNFRIKGMNRDIAMSSYSPEMAYEIYNMRVLATDDNTSFALTNEKGTELILTSLNLRIKGTVIGAAVLNNNLYVFTTDDCEQDRIYEIKERSSDDYTLTNLVEHLEEDLSIDYVYLNLSKTAPLEILPYYETEDIQKLYWVDGINQARMFNVVSKKLTFDFLPEMNLDNEIVITKKDGGGEFPPGVILYCFTFGMKNGLESNIFYTSPLFYTTRDAFSGFPTGEEHMCNCCFNIEFRKINIGAFDYVKVYSLLRTENNGAIVCRSVGEFSADLLQSSFQWEDASYDYETYANNSTEGHYIEIGPVGISFNVDDELYDEEEVNRYNKYVYLDTDSLQRLGESEDPNNIWEVGSSTDKKLTGTNTSDIVEALEAVDSHIYMALYYNNSQIQNNTDLSQLIYGFLYESGENNNTWHSGVLKYYNSAIPAGIVKLPVISFTLKSNIYSEVGSSLGLILPKNVIEKIVLNIRPILYTSKFENGSINSNYNNSTVYLFALKDYVLNIDNIQTFEDEDGSLYFIVDFCIPLYGNDGCLTQSFSQSWLSHDVGIQMSLEYNREADIETSDIEYSWDFYKIKIREEWSSQYDVSYLYDRYYTELYYIKLFIRQNHFIYSTIEEDSFCIYDNIDHFSGQYTTSTTIPTSWNASKTKIHLLFKDNPSESTSTYTDVALWWRLYRDTIYSHNYFIPTGAGQDYYDSYRTNYGYTPNTTEGSIFIPWGQLDYSKIPINVIYYALNDSLVIDETTYNLTKCKGINTALRFELNLATHKQVIDTTNSNVEILALYRKWKEIMPQSSELSNELSAAEDAFLYLKENMYKQYNLNTLLEIADTATAGGYVDDEGNLLKQYNTSTRKLWLENGFTRDSEFNNSYISYDLDIDLLWDTVSKDGIIIKHVEKFVPKTLYPSVIDTRDSGQSSVDIYHLLIDCQRPRVIPYTITSKDNTLFLGNLLVNSSVVSDDVIEMFESLRAEYTTKNFEGVDVNTYILQGSREIASINAIPFGNKQSSLSEGECATLNRSSRDNRIFKSREYYRIGILFMNSFGEKSEVVDLGYILIKDLNVDSVNINTWYPTYTLPINIIDKLQNSQLAYTYARLMMEEETYENRSILSQGILCPTIFNYGYRASDSPSSMASWFFRPLGTNALLPSGHYLCLSCNRKTSSEIQSLETEEDIYRFETTPTNYTYSLYVRFYSCDTESRLTNDYSIILGYIAEFSGTELNNKYYFDGSAAEALSTGYITIDGPYGIDSGTIEGLDGKPLHMFSTTLWGRHSMGTFSLNRKYNTVYITDPVDPSKKYKLYVGNNARLIKNRNYNKDHNKMVTDILLLVHATCTALGFSDLYDKVSTSLKNAIESLYGSCYSRWTDTSYSGLLTGNFTSKNIAFSVKFADLVLKARLHSLFYVDNSIITFNSPNIENVQNILDDNNQDIKLRIIGVQNTNSSYCKPYLDITITGTKHHPDSKGVYSGWSSDNKDMVSSYFGYVDDFCTPRIGVLEESAFTSYFLVYPWHRSPSLGSQKSVQTVTVPDGRRAEEYVSSDFGVLWYGLPKRKSLSNLRVYSPSQYFTVTEEDSQDLYTKSIQDIKVWNYSAVDTVLKLRVNKEFYSSPLITYQGNVDIAYVYENVGYADRAWTGMTTLVETRYKNRYYPNAFKILSSGEQGLPGVDFNINVRKLYYELDKERESSYGIYSYQTEGMTNAIKNANDNDWQQMDMMFLNCIKTEQLSSEGQTTTSYNNYNIDLSFAPPVVQSSDAFKKNLLEEDCQSYNLSVEEDAKKWLVDEAWITQSDEIGSIYAGNGWKSYKKRFILDPISIKYASSPHAVISLGDDGVHIDTIPNSIIGGEAAEGADNTYIYYDNKSRLLGHYHTIGNFANDGISFKSLNIDVADLNNYIYIAELYRSIPKFLKDSRHINWIPIGDFQKMLVDNEYLLKQEYLEYDDDAFNRLLALFLQNYLDTNTGQLLYNKLVEDGYYEKVADYAATLKGVEGDHFYNRWDCLKTYPYAETDTNLVVDIVSCVLESEINLNARTDRNRNAADNTIMTPNNFNLFNPVYDLSNNAFTYNNTGLKDTSKYDNQIAWSLTKSIAEDYDIWSIITTLSILDLDGTYGSLQKLLMWNNNIYAFQLKAISVINFNSRVLVSTDDDIPILITNSGKVDSSVILSNTTGCQNKWSVLTTNLAMYYIDNYRLGIYKISSEKPFPECISDSLGFHSWMNLNNSIYIWNSVELDNFKASYDDVNREVLFTNKNYCLAYSEVADSFTAFYSYEGIPFFSKIGNNLYSIKSDSETTTIWKLWGGDYNTFFGEKRPYWVTIIANQYPMTTKVFTNVEYTGDAFDPSLEYLYLANTTFDKITVWDEFLKGECTFSNITTLHSNDIKKKFRTWRVNIPRNTSNTGASGNLDYTKDRMSNPWINAKLAKLSPGTEKFVLHNIAVDYLEQ